MIKKRRCLKSEKETDNTCYIIGWCLLAAIGLYIIIQKFAGKEALSWPCLFRMWTGWYCPGCGGTRAMRALLSGRFFTSFFCHPVVPAAAALGGWFMISQTLERLSGGRFRLGMHIRGWHFGLILFLIAANFFVKNMALAVWGIRLL